MTGAARKASAGLLEPLLAFACAVAVAAALFWLSRAVAVVQQIMHAAIACVFLFGPQAAARVSGRPFDPRAAGITVEPIRRGLRVLGFAILVTWPVFVLAFLLYYGAICDAHGGLRALRDALAPICSGWRGIGGFRFRLPDAFVVAVLSQILVVAIPEEVFFRGYLMSRLEERWPSRWRLWGATVGWPWFVSSLLFAVGHFLVDLQPGRLAVFLPGLAFGWMRSRSGSVAPGAVFHALCNLLSEILHLSFF